MSVASPARRKIRAELRAPVPWRRSIMASGWWSAPHLLALLLWLSLMFTVAALDHADEALRCAGLQSELCLTPTAAPSHESKSLPDSDVLHRASIPTATYLPLISSGIRSQNPSRPQARSGGQSAPGLMIGHQLGLCRADPVTFTTRADD